MTWKQIILFQEEVGFALPERINSSPASVLSPAYLGQEGESVKVDLEGEIAELYSFPLRTGKMNTHCKSPLQIGNSCLHSNFSFCTWIFMLYKNVFTCRFRPLFFTLAGQVVFCREMKVRYPSTTIAVFLGQELIVQRLTSI